MTNYNIADIFTYTSFPQYTYINRTMSGNETYASRLKQALLVDENIVVILGAYKSGKTTLYKHVVPVSKLVNINGANIYTETDIWKQIAIQLDISFPSNYENTITNMEYFNEEKCNFIRKQLVDKNKILVIDDFQCISQKLQRCILNTLREVSLLRFKTIIVSVLHTIDSIIKYLPFGTTTIYIQPWKSKELEQIAYKGFSLLKINLTDYSINLLARESIACPQLMQENCYKLAIFAKEQNLTEIQDETARRIIPYMKDINFS